MKRKKSVVDACVCLVLGGNDPTPLSLALFEFQDFGKDIPPGARGGFGVRRHHIGAGHLEVHERDCVGFVAGVEQTLGAGAVFGVEGLLPPGFGVVAPEDAAPSEQSEFLLHNRVDYEA